MNWGRSRLALLFSFSFSAFSFADGDYLPTVIPDSFPVTVLEGVSFPKEYRGTFYTNVDPMERGRLKGRKIYLRPSVGFESALNREPLELPGMDGETIAIAVSRARRGVKNTVFETEEGGWARVKPEGFQLIITPNRTALYLTVTVLELRKAERGVGTTSERSMRIPLEDISDRVFEAADHFQSDTPWEDDRYYLPTEDEKLIPIKIVGHTNTNVWVVLTSEFTDPKATRMHVLRVRPNLLRRLPRGEIKRLRADALGNFPIEWYRAFYIDEAGVEVPRLAPNFSLQQRYESLWTEVHAMPGVISLPFPTVNCGAAVAAS